MKKLLPSFKAQICLGVSVFFSSNLAICQFQEKIGTPQYQEIGYEIDRTSTNDDYLIAGQRVDKFTDPASSNASLVKIKGNGPVLWSFEYGGKQEDIFYSVKRLRSLNPEYMATGSTQSFNIGGKDVLLVKTDDNGVPIFTKAFGGEKNDYAKCIQRIYDQNFGNGVIIAGTTESFPVLGRENILVIKYDNFGNIKQPVVIGNDNGEFGVWIERTSDKGYIILAETNEIVSSNFSSSKNILVIKTDADLNILWSRLLGTQDDEFPTQIKENKNGSYIISGYVVRPGTVITKAFLLELAPAGTLNWYKTYLGANRTWGHSLLPLFSDVTGATHYVFTGATDYLNTAGIKTWYPLLIQTDQAGNINWSIRYGSVEDTSYSISATTGTGFALAGNSYDISSNIFAAKTTANGLTNTHCDFQVKLLVEKPILPNREAFVKVVKIEPKEEKIESLFQAPYKVAKCNAILGTAGREQNEENLLNYGSIQLAPNPTNGLVKIIHNADYVGASVKIYSPLGDLKLTSSITNDSETQIDLGNLNPGVYLIEITKSNGTIEVLRLLKN